MSESFVRRLPRNILCLIGMLFQSPYATAAGLGGFGLISAAYLLYKTYLKNEIEFVDIDELWIYPVKSCKGIKVSQATITKFGFQYDREFMLVDINNKFTSQRSYPKMALIETKIDEKENNLVLTFEGHILKITLQRDDTLPCIQVTVWGDKGDAIDVGGSAATTFFSDYVGIPNMRLVRMSKNHNRPTENLYAPKGMTSFSDGYPFLLLSRESIAEINSRSSEKYFIENFRPNIVVKGCKYGFREDLWKNIVFRSSIPSKSLLITHDNNNKNNNNNNKTDIKMTLCKPCARCKMPSVDFNTGVMDPENKVTKLLKSFRAGGVIGLKNESWSKEVFVGQNLDHEAQTGGVIAVGDQLHVLSLQQ